MCTTPYEPATLNLIKPGKFTGSWRVYSCNCSVCGLGKPGLCTFYGVGATPPPWEGYSVDRTPPAPGKDDDAFIGVFVDALAARWQGELAGLVATTAAFIKTKLKRFANIPSAEAYVEKRVAKPLWVRRWVLEEHAHGAAAWAARLPVILARLDAFGWVPPTSKHVVTAAEFVQGVLLE